MIDAKVIVEKMKNQKINYDRVLQKMIQQWLARMLLTKHLY